MMSYSYFDHDADTGVIGRGNTPEEAFISAAEAMFAIMVNITMVHEVQHVQFDFEEEDVEFALVIWLNRLLTEARMHGLVFGRFHLHRSGARWEGGAWGESWRDALEKGVEVKGATLTLLSVQSSPAGWEARCVVDV